MLQQTDRPSRRDFLQKATTTIAAAMVAGAIADAQPSAPNADSMMMTIFLRHDETKTLDEINAHLEKTGGGKMRS
jgi:hypothetical protein